MHGPPLTIDEIARLLARETAELRRLGATLDKAVRVVAARHRVPMGIVTHLVVRQRRNERGCAERPVTV